MKYLEKIKTQLGILIFLQIILLVVLFAFNMEKIAIALLLIMILDGGMLIWIVYTVQKSKKQEDHRINQLLGQEASQIFEYGQVGLLTYDEQFNITWASELFFHRHLNLVGKKLTSFLPNIGDLFVEEVDVIHGKCDNRIYEVKRCDNGNLLYVKDITDYQNLQDKMYKDRLVLGIMHLDNYRDYSAFEDENRMAQLNVHLRQPIIDWAHDNGIIIRRLKSDQFLIVLDEEIYEKLVKQRFDILQKIRQNAQSVDANITLSMGIARGEGSLAQLDELSSELLELAQSRGGDQVASKNINGEVIFYGGKSESSNSRSRVRVRVMAQAIKEIIDDSNNIFIVGHQNTDFDCMGACLGLSKMIQTYGKETYIVAKDTKIESHLDQALKANMTALSKNHHFISEEMGLKLAGDNDLVLIVDHHDPEQSSASELVKKVRNSIVIDHHRRTSQFIDKPLLVYLESSASSTCELVSELIAYQPIRIGINDVEATFMYAGMLVDTNRFRSHTTFRTFEACALLKKWGANIHIAEQMLDEDVQTFEKRTLIYQNSFIYKNNIYISVVDGQIIEQSILAMGADTLLDVKGIEASFVIGKTSNKTIGISARSKGNINVQVIMESLNGGGHFAAAAAQFNDTDIKEVLKLLESKIDIYLDKEVKEHESNTN